MLLNDYNGKRFELGRLSSHNTIQTGVSLTQPEVTTYSLSPGSHCKYLLSFFFFFIISYHFSNGCLRPKLDIHYWFWSNLTKSNQSSKSRSNSCYLLPGFTFPLKINCHQITVWKISENVEM